MIKAFNSTAGNYAPMTGAVVIGVARFLSGAWQAAVQGPVIEAGLGLIGGGVTLASSAYGLFARGRARA